MVTVYSGPGCMQCKMTADILTEAGIEFNYVDISLDEKARDHVVNGLGFASVPVVEAPGDVFQGFRPERLRALAPVAA